MIWKGTNSEILKQDSAVTPTRVCRGEREKLNIQQSLQPEKEIDGGYIHGHMRIFAVRVSELQSAESVRWQNTLASEAEICDRATQEGSS